MVHSSVNHYSIEVKNQSFDHFLVWKDHLHHSQTELKRGYDHGDSTKNQSVYSMSTKQVPGKKSQDLAARIWGMTLKKLISPCKPHLSSW
jgi:hypothetical protein